MDKFLGSMYGVCGISGVKLSSKQLWEKLKQQFKTLIKRIFHNQIVVESVFLAKRKKPYYGGFFKYYFTNSNLKLQPFYHTLHVAKLKLSLRPKSSVDSNCKSFQVLTTRSLMLQVKATKEVQYILIEVFLMLEQERKFMI